MKRKRIAKNVDVAAIMAECTASGITGAFSVLSSHQSIEDRDNQNATYAILIVEDSQDAKADAVISAHTSGKTPSKTPTSQQKEDWLSAQEKK